MAAFADNPLFTLSGVEEHIDVCHACRTLLAGILRDSAHAWYPGQRVGRYVLGEPIGRGGMGAVWRADDPELGRAVALKRLHTGGRDRLFREARTLAQLQHPNVVAVFEVIDDPHAPFLAMELVDGKTLTAWLREPSGGSGARTWREVIAIFAQAGRGLAAAHARGLVHRDFKPDNVLVDNSTPPRARVADFGLASIDESELEAVDNQFCKLARSTASVAGTPAYMAPELLDGEPPDVRSDVYAFAVSLFEALHGQHPFGGDTMKERWIEMAAGRIRPGARRIPAWLERCVRKGLAVEPADRWQDVESFVSALEATPVRRRRVTLAVASAGIVALTSVATIAAFSHARADSADIAECAAGQELADSTWNPIVRETLVTQLTSSAADTTPATETARLVDHWVNSWQVGRRAACRAPSPERRYSRLSCLDHQLGELRGLLATWSSGVGTEQAVSAAAALPVPDACNSAADSPVIAQPLVVRITEAKTLYRAGRSPDAMPKLAGLLHDAEAIGHHDTLAQALLIASYIEHDLGNDEDALAHARRAATEASKADDDALLYSALVQQAYQQIDAGNPADALGILDAADALAGRDVPNPEKALSARGGALMRMGRIPEAIAQYDRAIAVLQINSDPDPSARIALGIAFAGRGNAYLEGRNPQRAITDQRHALDLQEATFGPRHPEVARTLYDLGQSEAEARDLDSSTTHLRRARDIFIANYGEHHPEVAQVDVALATNLKRLDRLDEARAAYERARAELTDVLPPNHLLFSVIENQLGSLEKRSGRCITAIPHFEAGYRILTENHAGGDELAHTDVELAQCLLDTGNSFDAKTRAEDALDQLSHAGLGDADRAVPWSLLAQVAMQRGDRKTAVSFARRVMAATQDDDVGSVADARARMQKLLGDLRVASR